MTIHHVFMQKYYSTYNKDPHPHAHTALQEYTYNQMHAPHTPKKRKVRIEYTHQTHSCLWMHASADTLWMNHVTYLVRYTHDSTMLKSRYGYASPVTCTLGMAHLIYVRTYLHTLTKVYACACKVCVYMIYIHIYTLTSVYLCVCKVCVYIIYIYVCTLTTVCVWICEVCVCLIYIYIYTHTFTCRCLCACMQSAGRRHGTHTHTSCHTHEW